MIQQLEIETVESARMETVQSPPPDFRGPWNKWRPFHNHYSLAHRLNRNEANIGSCMNDIHFP